MKDFKVSLPSNLNQLVAMAGIAMVLLSTFGVRPIWPPWAVPVVGAFLGYFCVRDVKGFLIAGLALIAAKWGLGHVPYIGSTARLFTTNLIALVAPAMLVVAIRAIYYEIKGGS